MSGELTTAEQLVRDLVVASIQLGDEVRTFSRRLWVRPQLDSLANKGLLTWKFDDNADFEATPTSVLCEQVGVRSLATLSVVE